MGDFNIGRVKPLFINLVYYIRLDIEEVKIMGVTAAITAITFLMGIFINGKALLTTSDLEQVFLTREQKIKMYYYQLFVLSILIAVFGGYIYLVWKWKVDGISVVSTNWSFAIALTIVIFICSYFTIGTILKLIHNFFIKEHYKYKVKLDKVGEVYILKMMSQDICICSKNPNANFLRDDKENILVKVDDIIRIPLIKTKHTKPSMSLWKKLLD
jgi:hypothetical protein